MSTANKIQRMAKQATYGARQLQSIDTLLCSFVSSDVAVLFRAHEVQGRHSVDEFIRVLDGLSNTNRKDGFYMLKTR